LDTEGPGADVGGRAIPYGSHGLVRSRVHMSLSRFLTLRATIVAGVLSAVLLLLGVAASPVRAGGTSTPVSGLSPQQLAGERVIYSYSGLTPPASLLEMIRAGEAAGVIFFSENISSEAQIRRVIGELRHAAAQSPVKAPLLMMTDQEGGQVRRLPGAPTLSEKQIGASAHPGSAAQQAGRGAGLNLKGVGMNVNLAPVLDVYRTPFIDHYGRSCSSNPQKVAQLGADFIKAQQQTGVAATAKHFPGLGAATTRQDTDDQPVTLNLPLTSLRAVDELPYRSAISGGVRLVMVSWATYPALDPHRPAGLSFTVVHGELRQRLKFTGVTITDALEAGALRAFGATANRALLAARAGMDLLLCSSQNVSQGTTAVNALASLLRNGQLNTPAFLAAVKRVIALRSSP
jgi:beta-N-acetylhexosaminidase